MNMITIDEKVCAGCDSVVLKYYTCTTTILPRGKTKTQAPYFLNIGQFDHAVLEHCINTKTCAHFKVTHQDAILVFWAKDLPRGGEQLEVVYKFNRFYDKSGPFCLQTRGYQSCHILSGNIEATETDIAKTIAKLIKQGERVAKALNLKKPGFPETMMDSIPTNKGA